MVQQVGKCWNTKFWKHDRARRPKGCEFLKLVNDLLVGLAALVLSVRSLIRRVLPYAPADRMVEFDSSVLALTLAAAVGIGVLAGLYPSWKASHVPPMKAIRNE